MTPLITHRSIAYTLLVGASTMCAIANAPPTDIPQEIAINSGRPTFYNTQRPLAGKIALEEHVGNSLFKGLHTTPFVNYTNEANFDLPAFDEDVAFRMHDIDSRIAAMDAANISMSIVMLSVPGIQGIFNTSFATYAARYVNDELARVYKDGNYSSRFGFWCNNALQDPSSAAQELERCVKELGGVGSFVGGYTNNGSANNIVYLDDPVNDVFLAKVAELDVPIYLHPRPPAPDQQRVYEGYWELAASPWGYAAETGAHALRLMLSGVFDRYPNLKIILGHAGEGLPFHLNRIDSRLRHVVPYWPAKRCVTYYWENNFFVTTAGISSASVLQATLAVSGEDRVMFSVDYPFEDDVEIGTWFDGLELAGPTKEKLAFGNARRILKLDAAE